MRFRLIPIVGLLVVASCGGGSGDGSALDLGGDATTRDSGAGDLGGPADAGPPGDLGADAHCADADGDGHRDAACGGDDCDDTDPHRYPSNPELCNDHDEDCDPTTLGPDGDGDGFTGTSCCNPQPSGMLACGTDCDDSRATVNPTAAETCNGLDDDCNGVVDDGGVRLTFFHDIDGDGYGDSSMPMMACTAPLGYVLTGGDCDDTRPSVHPGLPDGPTANCDGLDNDCDGTPDRGCPCIDGHTQTCGMSSTAPCHLGMQTCAGAAWGACIGSVDPMPETCNGVDDDCNGTVDDGLCSPDVADACGVPCDRGCVAATCSHAATCTPHRTDFVWDAFDPRFSHQPSCSGSACGSSWCVPSGGTGCYPIYGGAIVLPGATYDVTFYLTHETAGADLMVDIDVADAAGGSLATGTVAVHYGTEATPILRVDVPPGCAPLQLRVRFDAPGTDLRIRAFEAVLVGTTATL